MALEAAERNHAELLQDRDDTIASLQDQVINTLEAAETRYSSLIHERDEKIESLQTEIEGLRHDLQTSRNALAAGGSEEDFLDRETFIREMEDLKSRCVELETLLEIARRELLDERERLGGLRRKLTGEIMLHHSEGERDDPFGELISESPGGFESRPASATVGADGDGEGSIFSESSPIESGSSSARMSTLEGTVSFLLPSCTTHDQSTDICTARESANSSQTAGRAQRGVSRREFQVGKHARPEPTQNRGRKLEQWFAPRHL
jgi:hypothetical protein